MNKILLIIFIILINCQFAQAATVNSIYFRLGDFQTNVLDHSGITVTGSADVSVSTRLTSKKGGLGVSGGLDDTLLGPSNEYLAFNFNDGAVTNISWQGQLFQGVSPDKTLGKDNPSGEHLVEAFDKSGQSLGVLLQSEDNYDFARIAGINISLLYGNIPISSFVISTPFEDSLIIGAISYSTVPIPPAILLFSVALLGMIWKFRIFHQ